MSLLRRVISLSAGVLMVLAGIDAVEAQAAAADSLTVSPSVTSAATGVPFEISFTGSDTPSGDSGDTPYLYALVRRANGVGCEPTFGQDQQVAGTDDVTVLDGDYATHVPDGSFSEPSTASFSAGSYIVCAWLETDDDDGSGSDDDASQTVTAASSSSFTIVNTDTLHVTLPSRLRRGRPFEISFTGSDTPFDDSGDTPYLYALVRRANGVGCEPTFGQDQQVAGTDDVTVLDGDYATHVPDGSFSEPSTASFSAGSYIVCAWLETDDDDGSGSDDDASQTVTAAATTTFSLPGRSRTPCVVPRYRGATLTAIKRLLRRSHCGVGRVSHRRDRAVRRGRVVRLSARSGRRLPHGTPIAIWISEGGRGTRR